MVHWNQTLDIKAEFKAAEEDPIKIPDLCRAISQKLSQLVPYDDIEVENERARLIDMFSDLWESLLDDPDEFDVYMDELYNWGDVGFPTARDRVCWIEAF